MCNAFRSMKQHQPARANSSAPNDCRLLGERHHQVLTKCQLLLALNAPDQLQVSLNPTQHRWKRRRACLKVLGIFQFSLRMHSMNI